MLNPSGGHDFDVVVCTFVKGEGMASGWFTEQGRSGDNVTLSEKSKGVFRSIC